MGAGGGGAWERFLEGRRVGKVRRSRMKLARSRMEWRGLGCR